jgi:ribonuclease HI
LSHATSRQAGAAPGYLIHVDGSSRHNPGPAGIGVRICRGDGSVYKEISRSIGIRTNNQAEYEAFICALREARLLSDAPVTVRTDSELLYYQMTGRYRVRNPGIRSLYETACRLMLELPHVNLEIVPRGKNRETDRLARDASAACVRPDGRTD